MKTLLCSLAAILALAQSGVVGAADVKDQQVSGTVVEYNPGFLTIEDSKKERWEFHAELGNQRYTPKVGDKVLVHYETGPHGWVFTYKVEKSSKKD